MSDGDWWSPSRPLEQRHVILLLLALRSIWLLVELSRLVKIWGWRTMHQVGAIHRQSGVSLRDLRKLIILVSDQRRLPHRSICLSIIVGLWSSCTRCLHLGTRSVIQICILMGVESNLLGGCISGVTILTLVSEAIPEVVNLVLNGFVIHVYLLLCPNRLLLVQQWLSSNNVKLGLHGCASSSHPIVHNLK